MSNDPHREVRRSAHLVGRRAILAALLICICSATPARSDDEVDVSVQRFQELIARGDELMARGRPAEALETYEAADAVDIFEAPNYEALIRIAEAHCRLGEREKALSLLADFRCALRVDAGELSCWVGEPTATAPGEDNPALTPGCRLRMCGEIYLEYYSYMDPYKRQRLGDLGLRADRLERACSGDAGCTFASDGTALAALVAPYPFRVAYEGPFPRTTEGVSFTAYLDDEHVVRTIHVSYLGETGQAEAVYELKSGPASRVSWEHFAYDRPIYQESRPTVKSIERRCMSISNGVETDDADTDPIAASLETDLALILSQYLPCPSSPEGFDE